MKIDESKLTIQNLVEKNHKLDTEHKNIKQVSYNKVQYIKTLLDETMKKDMELDEIHNVYNEKVVKKDTTIQDFSQKHNVQMSSINEK